MKWPNHGGQPETIKQLFKLKEDVHIHDFSANLNPLGPPAWLEEEISNQYHTITSYPEPSYLKCSISVAAHESIDPNMLLLTNGGAEAIFLIAKYFENLKAMVVHPTFMEYERACKHYHISVEQIMFEQENEFGLPIQTMCEKLKETDVIFLCRPNNPTGTVINERDLLLLLEEGKKTGTSVVVDEAFVNFLPASVPSLSSWLATYPNLILLRSLTKMYTIPGLRIGYIMANPLIINALRDDQIPWSINSIVDAIVPKLLDDVQFVERTKDWLSEQSQYVYKKLASIDFYHSPSQVNFYLLRDKKQPHRTEELFHFLLQNGILTRHTHNFKGLNGDFLRLAIRSKEENERLLMILQKWRNET
ncbi:threonine-phosphate decarboxylase CobD [Litchfieldia salsa]|uniref:threonine-phosphate decarboxylase n=1 Tax=Litchfieldia salsa TaxID=930152 RepID=A0A1H0URL1_9BACI|nr:threonine-phosphate decarboxylase CobD [Litchfieldia salsa]SDP68794.1 L-threonine O-3-phosphate decarboxylase [Litchfieldia salsa]